MDSAEGLVQLIRQRTWDKELILWFGPEAKLLPFLTYVRVVKLDLLDLFDASSIPIEDDDLRQHLSHALRLRLKAIQHPAGERTALIVRSAGLLARYRVGVQDFYDWFCDDFAMAVLLIEGRCSETEWPDEVECAPDKLLSYFLESGFIKRLIGA
jgi:hypothetical protein